MRITFLKIYSCYRKGFRKCMGLIGMVSKSALCDLYFNAFDIRNEQALTFEDYITSLHVMTRGTEDEKLRFSFRILDMDRSGYITYEEWAIMIKSAAQIMVYIDSITGSIESNKGEGDIKYKASDENLKKSFCLIDTNNDGKFNYEDFKIATTKYPNLLHLMNSNVNINSATTDTSFLKVKDFDKSKALVHIADTLKISKRDISITARILNDSLILLDDDKKQRRLSVKKSLVSNLKEIVKDTSNASKSYLNSVSNSIPTSTASDTINLNINSSASTTPIKMNNVNPIITTSSSTTNEICNNNPATTVAVNSTPTVVVDEIEVSMENNVKVPPPITNTEIPNISCDNTDTTTTSTATTATTTTTTLVKENSNDNIIRTTSKRHKRKHHKNSNPETTTTTTTTVIDKDLPSALLETPTKLDENTKLQTQTSTSEETSTATTANTYTNTSTTRIRRNKSNKEKDKVIEKYKTMQNDLNDLLKKAAKQQLMLMDRVDNMQKILNRILYGEIPEDDNIEDNNLKETLHFNPDDVITSLHSRVDNIPMDDPQLPSNINNNNNNISNGELLEEELIEDERNSERMRSLSQSQSKGMIIDFGHENWNMVLNLMNGIKLAVSRTAAEADRPLERDDYTMKEKFSIVAPRIEGEDEQPVCRFVDYAPMVFKKLREHWGVSASEYLQSIGPQQLLEGLMRGDLTSLSELCSEGKSGSFFYYTRDGNYMVKTVSHGEHILFRRTLQDYYSHILTNKDTLLIHYMGAHQMRFSKHKTGGKRIYFVVMGNLFNTPYDIHWKYDLKGSWVGRYTKGKKDPNIALKDLDLKEPFHVGPDLKTQLINQLKADTDFLASHNIIDYSLLVGVHNREEPFTKSVKKIPGVPFYQRDSGGLLSSDKKHIYFFGIIDTLIKYDNYKRGELFFKSFAFDRRGISCQPPQTYANRFMLFMSKKID